MSRELNVGSIVFVLDGKTNRVVPCQLVEIISSVTIDGNSTSHVVTTPGNNKRIVLEKSSNPWFASAEEARNHLRESANLLIQKTIEQAVSLANEFYGPEVVKSSTSPQMDIFEANDVPVQPDKSLGQSVYVDMAGQKVKVNLPPELSHE